MKPLLSQAAHQAAIFRYGRIDGEAKVELLIAHFNRLAENNDCEEKLLFDKPKNDIEGMTHYAYVKNVSAHYTLL